MSLLVLYICITFGLFGFLSMVLVNYTFNKRRSVTRYFITGFNIAISIDTCLYLNNCGWLLGNISLFFQKLLKDLLGLVFLFRNNYLDYAFALILIYVLYLVIFFTESSFGTVKRSYSMRTYRHEAKHHKSKHMLGSISSLVSIICTITTTLIALLTFIFKLYK